MSEWHPDRLNCVQRLRFDFDYSFMELANALKDEYIYNSIHTVKSWWLGRRNPSVNVQEACLRIRCKQLGL